MPVSRIFVEHNAEIAHRLSLLPGKCQQIHGHSLHIELVIEGQLDKNGILAGLDFGAVKKIFRSYIDTNLDHHLHLNKDDAWAGPLGLYHGTVASIGSELPGLRIWPGDPTTENLAKWICDEMFEAFMDLSDAISQVGVVIGETKTNGAEYWLP